VIKLLIRRVLRRLGYDILKIPAIPKRIALPNELPPAVEPVWPLPRCAHGLTDTAIREQFRRYSTGITPTSLKAVFLFPPLTTNPAWIQTIHAGLCSGFIISCRT